MSNSNKKWRKRNPEKVRAHWIVSNAIRYGKLVRQPCEECGNKKSHAHHNDYSKPLEIQWLCHRCHWNKHGWIRNPKESAKSKPGWVAFNDKRPKLLEKVIELRNKGTSYKQIANKLKLSVGTVYKWINKPDYY
jgi:transposase-like protein